MNKFLIKTIEEMVKIDQAARFKTLEDKKKSGEKGLGMGNFMIYAIDAVHQFRIRELIKEYGYPTKNKVGEETLKSFWLLIQHQDYDLRLQKNCLNKCGFVGSEKAHLTDRIYVNSGKDQIYGTQLNKPIKNKNKVNKMRIKLGLEKI